MESQPRPLRKRSWRARLRDPRTVSGVLAVILVVTFAAAAVLSGGTLDVRNVVVTSPSPSASVVITEPSPQPTAVLPASFSPLPEQTPVPPEATPEGVNRVAETSAPISPPPGSPTPTPDPLVWRFEGAVVDADGKPLRNVCVIIGPHGCQRGSIRTDESGRYYVDMPQNPTVVYDFFFALDGHEVVWHRAQPSGPTVFNVILRRL